MKNQTYDLSIRCYYPNGNKTEHRQTMKLNEIPKWIEAYKFTHPLCESVTIKIWLNNT